MLLEARADIINRSSHVELQGEWQSVHRALQRLATQRAGLDAEEARWLREAEACQVWRRVGMVSLLDYMERVLGYTPRVAQERLRVARALGGLPALTEALARGGLSFSAVRELTRVATPATELAWRDAVVGMNVRQIEELVADHRPGDRPEDPGDPEVRTRVVRLELAAETFALWRQTRQALDEAHGTHRSDDELVAALCDGLLDGAAARESSGRAKFQIAITVCERCRQGWQEGAGAKIAISSGAVERACCDAQHIGSIDGAAPQRAYQDVAPSVARLVWRRDGGRCRVPGCRSSRGLELHHLVHRADGGSHDAENLCVLCSSCHQSHHAGTLTISGTAARIEVTRVGEACGRRTAVANAGSHVGAVVGLHTEDHAKDARTALVELGWKPAIAQAAVADAVAALDDAVTLEGLIRAALQRCGPARA
jgi:RuvA, C-terminal domain/HNH endonuclease